MVNTTTVKLIFVKKYLCFFIRGNFSGEGIALACDEIVIVYRVTI